MQYDWAEDDFELPQGVDPLGGEAPEDGRRYVMYHGTTRQCAELIVSAGFRQSPDGMLGRGVYLSRDLQKAKRYPLHHPEAEKVGNFARSATGRARSLVSGPTTTVWQSAHSNWCRRIVRWHCAMERSPNPRLNGSCGLGRNKGRGPRRLANGPPPPWFVLVLPAPRWS
ncbi:uncharacterized protein LOC144087953 isoform X1 [Stigmatopora argus]